jgi:hypothetical protein
VVVGGVAGEGGTTGGAIWDAGGGAVGSASPELTKPTTALNTTAKTIKARMI